MLAFARNYELKQEVIGIPELVRGMTELLQRSVGPTFNIETRFPLALKPIEVDANQLELALLNLTLNARDAMSDGGDIILTAREEDVADADSGGLEAGQLYPPQRDRYRRRDGRRDIAQSGRAIFHDQRRWQGDRPRPFDGAWICRAKWRAFRL